MRLVNRSGVDVRAGTGRRSGESDAGMTDAVAADGPGADEPTLPVAAVARRLGVAPATLRTWDRRYGLGPSRHTGGKHRRYAPDDVARLEVMQRALLAGASTAEAAQYALDTVRSRDEIPPEPAIVVPRQQGPPSGDAGVEDVRGDAPTSRLARRLSSATLAMDARMVRRLLADALASDGPVAAWENTIRPVLAAVGAGWQNNRTGPEAEALLADLSMAALTRATPAVDRPSNHHPVLLASQPTERRSLAMFALAAGLAERNIDAIALSPAQPADVLVAMVRRTVPAAVVLYSRTPRTGNAALFDRLTRGRLRSRLFACGPGWAGVALPGTVEQLGSLPTAVERISYVLLGTEA